MNRGPGVRAYSHFSSIMCLDHASAKGAFLKKMSHSPVNEGLNYGRRIKEKNMFRDTRLQTPPFAKRGQQHRYQD